MKRRCRLNQLQFIGNVNITGGLVSYTSDAAFGNAANQIILNGGGLLDSGRNLNVAHNIVVNAGGGVIRGYGSSTPSVSGTITGAGTLNRTDGGTLSLTGDLSGFTGTFDNQAGSTILPVSAGASVGGNWNSDGGTLDINGRNVNSTGGLGGAFKNGSATTATVTMNLGAANASNFAGAMTSPAAGNLNFIINTTAGGTASDVAWTGVNTFKGTITVNGTGFSDGIDAHGILGVNADAALGNSANNITLNNGGTLCNMSANLTAGGWNSHAAVTLAATRTINLTGAVGGVLRIGYGDTMTVNSLITGTSLAHVDGGVLVLGNANTFNGTMTNNAGSLTLTNANALQNATLALNSGPLTFDSTLASHSVNLGGLGGGGNVALQDNAATPVAVALSVGSSNTTTNFTGVMSGIGTLTKVGTGILGLSNANTFSTQINVQGGILSVGNYSTAAVSGGTNTSLGSGPVNVSAGAQLVFSNTGLTIANNVTLNGLTTNGALVGAIATGTQANTLAGTLTLAATSNLSTYWSDKTLTITGQVTGAGGLTIDSWSTGGNGGSNIVLNNTTNNYQGTTTVDAPTGGAGSPILRAGAANVIPSGASAGNVVVNGILDLNGFSQAINGLSGTGTVDNKSGTGSYALIVGNNNQTSSFSGIITNTTGSVGLTKTGSGIFSIANTETYSGPTTILGGKLTMATGGKLPALSALVMSGGTLNTNGISQTAGTLQLTASSTIDFGVGSNTLTLAASNGVSWTGATSLTILEWNGSQAGNGLDRFIVGTNTSGLSSAQLSQINFSGYPNGAQILSTGEIVPLPEPTSLALLGLGVMGLLARRRRRANPLNH